MGGGLRHGLVLGSAFLALAGCVLTGRLWGIHEQTSDWVLWPREVPSKVQFAGREYNCGPDPEPARTDVSLLTVQGKTVGGAEILAAPSSDEARVFIVVRTAERNVACGLLGGP